MLVSSPRSDPGKRFAITAVHASSSFPSRARLGGRNSRTADGRRLNDPLAYNHTESWHDRPVRSVGGRVQRGVP
jgi:hypothetical protein